MIHNSTQTKTVMILVGHLCYYCLFTYYSSGISYPVFRILNQGRNGKRQIGITSENSKGVDIIKNF